MKRLLKHISIVRLRKPLPLTVPVGDDVVFAPIWARIQSAQFVPMLRDAFHRWLVLYKRGLHINFCDSRFTALPVRQAGAHLQESSAVPYLSVISLSKANQSGFDKPVCRLGRLNLTTT